MQTENKTRIINYLKANHLGSENSITFKDLSLKLGINSRELRNCVAEIVTKGEGCIGTNSRDGYFYVVTDEEFEYSQNDYRSRALKLLMRRKGQRIARIRDINDMAKPRGGQQKLFKVLETA